MNEHTVPLGQLNAGDYVRIPQGPDIYLIAGKTIEGDSVLKIMYRVLPTTMQTVILNGGDYLVVPVTPAEYDSFRNQPGWTDPVKLAQAEERSRRISRRINLLAAVFMAVLMIGFNWMLLNSGISPKFLLGMWLMIAPMGLCTLLVMASRYARNMKQLNIMLIAAVVIFFGGYFLMLVPFRSLMQSLLRV